jgi:hypothetical protein
MNACGSWMTVSLDGCGLAVEDSRQVRALFIVTGLERMAGSALLEQRLAFFDIAGASASNANQRHKTHQCGGLPL